MKHLLAPLANGQPLSFPQTVEAFELIMTGQASASQVGALLAFLQARGPTVDEIAGAATVMREKAMPVIVPPHLTVVDTVGTGGDHAKTFNISTAASVVTAAAARPFGVAVAKHGNRSVTSQSGSSQVLETLGVKLRVSEATLTQCLDEAGLCFCYAPAHHPAMKHAASIRQELGFRSIFNLLGPLTNPAGARHQVVGVYSDDLTETVAQVLRRLGSKHAMVVHGCYTPPATERSARAGLDEITTTGPTRISHLQHDRIATYTLDATTLGLAPASIESLRVDGPDASALMIRTLLGGAPGPARDIVCLNAAATLLVVDIAKDMAHGIQLAQQAIDSGLAMRSLRMLVDITQRDKTF